MPKRPVPATNAPKPSVAEAQKVVQMISGDDQIARRVEADIVG
jgi:hypothetical protein